MVIFKLNDVGDGESVIRTYQVKVADLTEQYVKYFIIGCQKLFWPELIAIQNRQSTGIFCWNYFQVKTGFTSLNYGNYYENHRPHLKYG
jgi:hypothetical protein